MTLGLTPEHLELAAVVRGWVQRHSPAATVRIAADGPDSGTGQYHAEFVPGLAELGLFGLHVAEVDGGQGYGLPELAVALEELGRALLPGAFLPTVLASAILSEADLPQAEPPGANRSEADSPAADPPVAHPAGTSSIGKLIAGLADGSRTGAVSLADGLTATAGQDGGLVISGESGPVLAGSMADLIIAPVQTADGPVWVAIDSGDLQITALHSLDLTRPVASMRAAGVVIAADRVLTGVHHSAVTSLAAILFGAEA